MTYPLVPTTRQMYPGTTFAIRLAVPLRQLYLRRGGIVSPTVSHGGEIWEGHSPQSVEIDTGSMLEHCGTDTLWRSLLVFWVVV